MPAFDLSQFINLLSYKGEEVGGRTIPYIKRIKSIGNGFFNYLFITFIPTPSLTRPTSASSKNFDYSCQLEES
jgi:hypothetical protein